jgi:hypothetical protein
MLKSASRFTLILATMLVSTPHLVLADDHNDGGSTPKGWFVEGRYQKSLSEATGFNDGATDNTRVTSATGESFDNLDSTGIAVGRFFNDGKVSLSLGYENFGTVNKKFVTGTSVAAVTRDIVMPMDINNMMLEVNYNLLITKDMFATGLIGLGQSTISAKRFSFRGIAAAGTANEVKQTSSRLGLGLGYNVSDKVQIIGLVQSSKYGDASVNTDTAVSPTLFKSKVSATEASIRARFVF